MRIWSISPKYLDAKGLLAVWRETLLAKHVLEGKTIGYKNHPQLQRFKESINPLGYINAYLSFIFEEATTRSYNFDESKFIKFVTPSQIPVTTGQIDYELVHLRNKISNRSPHLLHQLPSTADAALVVPIFKIVTGNVESWEVQK